MLFLLFAPFQDRVLESLERDPDSSLLWRETLWHDVTTQALEDGRIVFGSGLDTFHLMAERLRGIRLGPNEAHNDFVKFFVEGGIIGLAAFLAYLGSILLILYRGYKKAPSMRLRTLFGFLLIFFLVLQTAALTDNVFKNTPVQWLFFVTLGGALALAGSRTIPRHTTGA
jgi:O-antigen ligase